MELSNIKAKVDKYTSILETTKKYRSQWPNEIKKILTETLEKIVKETKLKAIIEYKDDIENLEVVNFSLGTEVSGIAEKFPGNKTKRPFIKNNGSLIFQQLFNGKLMIMILYPFIEGYGQPKPPKNVEIIRPEELSEAFILRYVEQFLQEVIEWEDFDDDMPEKMGMNPIGFGSSHIITDESDHVQ
jgi:hypothetical protein